HDELLEAGGSARAREVDLRHASGRELAKQLVLPAEPRSAREIELQALAVRDHLVHGYPTRRVATPPDRLRYHWVHETESRTGVASSVLKHPHTTTAPDDRVRRARGVPGPSSRASWSIDRALAR